MDVIAAYRELGSFRAAAAVTGTTHKTVKRIVEAAESGPPEHKARGHNYHDVADIVRARVARTSGRISAKRLLPEARAAGYGGSARNFRRLVAAEKEQWRRGNHRGRRPGVWAPGEVLAIDWGVESGLHVFCAVAAWSRFRFVRFADNERRTTTLSFLAECFETLGGVPKVVLADRMGCLKAGVVANLVVPVPDYVRFATHYGFRPDFCEAADPESKGLVEHLVGYAKSDLVVPEELSAADLGAANEKATIWCAEVNAAVHTETLAVPAERLERERELFSALPSLRASLVPIVTRKVDKLSCVRFGSARYSVPLRHVGRNVQVRVEGSRVEILDLGELVATHTLLAPGEVSICDEHYGGPRPAPRRAPRARTEAERAFLSLGEVATQWLRGAAAPLRRHAFPPSSVSWGTSRRPSDVSSSLARSSGRCTSGGFAPVMSEPSWRQDRASNDGPTRVRLSLFTSARSGRGSLAEYAPEAFRERGGATARRGLGGRSPAPSPGRDRALHPSCSWSPRPNAGHPRCCCGRLVESEIAARDASNARNRLTGRSFPASKTLEEFDLPVLLGETGHLRLSGEPRVDRSQGELPVGRPRGHGQVAPARCARSRCRRRRSARPLLHRGGTGRDALSGNGRQLGRQSHRGPLALRPGDRR